MIAQHKLPENKCMLLKKRHILVNVHRTTDEYVIQHHIFYAGVWRPEANSNNWLENHFYMVILCQVLNPLSPSHTHTDTNSTNTQMERKRRGGERWPHYLPFQKKRKDIFHTLLFLRNITLWFNDWSYLQCPLSDPFDFFWLHLISHNLKLLFLNYSCK